MPYLIDKEHQNIINEFISYYYNIKNQLEIYNQTLNHHHSLIDKQEMNNVNITQGYGTILNHIMDKCLQYMMIYNLDFSLLGSFYYDNKDEIEDIRAKIVRDSGVVYESY